MERYQGFVLRKAGGMRTLLDLRDPEVSYKKPLQLNETGADLWERLQLGLTPDAIADEIAGEYDISREDALSDILMFVNNLKDFGVPIKE